MDSAARFPDLMGPGRVSDMTRRGFLGVTGAAGSAALVAPSVPARPLSQQQRAMILRVASAVAVFPIAFPGFGEAGPATARVTTPRLLAAARRLSSRQLALARAGADDLIARGLPDQDQARLLAAIGAQAGATPGTSSRLTAVSALAIATVSRRFNPSSDSFALVWTGVLRRMHERGVLGRAVARRGIR